MERTVELEYCGLTLEVEGSYYEGCPGDRDTPSSPSGCDIEYVRILQGSEVIDITEMLYTISGDAMRAAGSDKENNLFLALEDAFIEECEKR